MPKASETKLIGLVRLTLLALPLPALPFRLTFSDIDAEYRHLHCTAMMQGRGAGSVVILIVWREPIFAFEFDQALFEFA